MAEMRKEITSFVHQDNESLNDAWERFNELLRRCPRHCLPEWQQVETFYSGLVPSTRVLLGAACGGSVSSKTPEDALHIIETMAVRSANYLSDRQSQREGLEVETLDTLLAQNKALLGQLASLTQQFSSIQAKIVAPPSLECDSCKDSHENGNCQANQQEEQVNILDPQGSQGNSSLQDQGQSFNHIGSKFTSLEEAFKKLTVDNATFMEETNANIKNLEVSLRNLKDQVEEQASANLFF